ncbi:MAG TPA: HEAT repeat domain-containing protein [Terriglobales bacterium]|jgi:HEAT repeat protein|nr:HEAT repeat domain-containing protein [Terriglobales bacterium]
MVSVFRNVRFLQPATLVAKAIVVAFAADIVLLAFILIRRGYRKHYFAKRDARVFYYRQRWNALISGEIPYNTWRKKAFDRGIIETIALDAFEAAGPQEATKLLKFLRTSGLIEKRIHEARELRGWKRMRALVALGRTRAPEGIIALAEGLRDRDLEIRLAALRGLARMASPQAAEEILACIGERGLVVPALPLQNALVQCCAERPQILLPYVQHAQGPVRETLGRVLGEVANASMAFDLMQFLGDDLDELRAAAARAMSNVQPGLAFDSLTQLAEDPIWFVRLRAVVSLGKISNPRAVAVLLRGLTDSNRLVRLRAAESLIQLRSTVGLAVMNDNRGGAPQTVDALEKVGLISVFEQVAALKDRYGLHAYMTALENANLRGKLEEEIRQNRNMTTEKKNVLLEVLETGRPPVEAVVDEKAAVET